jgi:AraC-like DNA-binding protein
MKLLHSTGLIYRNQYNDLERSDDCFNKILEIPFKPAEDVQGTTFAYMQDEHDLWTGCAGGNFNTFINEYRIKEAVRLMSDCISKNMSLEDVASAAGYNDRTTFYRSFKKNTGLSPSQFKNKLG